MIKTFYGSCHCQAVRFEVKADIDHSARCDCSLCRRRNTIMLRCDESDLRITLGREYLSRYQFNTMTAEHYFCSRCGVYTFHKMRKFPDKYAVNAGCLEGVDPYLLKPTLNVGSNR